MSQKEMRVVLAETLGKIMAEDDRIVVIDADLAKANGTFALRQTYPERALDVGIAEQNMASVAAGMASCGMIPFISSFTPFVSRRICDQVAISICYAKSNVKIIGTDPCLTAELNGGTHMSVEDIGVLRSIPDLIIYEAVDNIQLEQALPQIIAYEGPVYIRMFRKVIGEVFDRDGYHFDLFKADVVAEGSDVTILASGLMVQESLKALELFKSEGISAELISVHTVKPLDEDTIIKSASKTGAVVTCENHSVVGGLGSAVAEALSKSLPTPMRMVGVQDRFGQVGTLPFLMKEYKMTAHDIVNAAKDAISAKSRQR
ncbi:MAG: transketolase family protein, partial [Acetanaerobacterium sp.]